MWASTRGECDVGKMKTKLKIYDLEALNKNPEWDDERMVIRTLNLKDPPSPITVDDNRIVSSTFHDIRIIRNAAHEK